jgi:hypothetical protein
MVLKVLYRNWQRMSLWPFKTSLAEKYADELVAAVFELTLAISEQPGPISEQLQKAYDYADRVLCKATGVDYE